MIVYFSSSLQGRSKFQTDGVIKSHPSSWLQQANDDYAPPNRRHSANQYTDVVIIYVKTGNCWREAEGPNRTELLQNQITEEPQSIKYKLSSLLKLFCLCVRIFQRNNYLVLWGLSVLQQLQNPREEQEKNPLSINLSQGMKQCQSFSLKSLDISLV